MISGINSKPIIVLAFSNNHDSYLKMIAQERKGIFEALHDQHDRGDVQVHKEENTSVDDIYGLFNRYTDRIAIFHYGGHADGKHLQLERDFENAEPANALGLAKLMGLQKSLQLVFLNGCATFDQVERLFACGVKTVIATSVSVDDELAAKFAVQFYKALASQVTIERAFEMAQAYFYTLYGNSKEISKFRALNWAGKKAAQPSAIPWGLYINTNGDEALQWKLPQFNEHTISYQQSADDLEQRSKEFISQISIAGQLEDTYQNRRAIYLDDDLYVHRRKEESQILQMIENFIENSQRKGMWVSIVGDAGHGKSCLLWYVHNQMKNDARIKVISLLAQMLTDQPWNEMKETVARIAEKNRQQAIIVLIDTLDILIGMDDAALSAALNTLIATGCLLITCCRKQEAERLVNHIQCDLRIELKRYSDREAEEAIRKYIEISYPDWNQKEKESQFKKVAGLLEQRREEARELDFEPLILRMIFEVYVPEDIPQDLNTQKVYKRFWEKRVLADRVKTSAEQFAREQLSRFLARQIAFGEVKSHSDTFPIDALCECWDKESSTTGFPFEVMESLVSSGVCQWAKGRSAVRFFHQTFFEYTAAHDLLCLSNKELQANRINMLCEDVAKFNFFRVPIIKQLAIQDFYESQELWNNILKQLRQVNNALSAQLALEIIGKIQETVFCLDFCNEWIMAESSMLAGIVVETVKYYPKSKIEIGLEFLKPYLTTNQENAIYSLCKDSFAGVAPYAVHRFLRTTIHTIKLSDDEHKRSAFYRTLSATFQYGAIEALDDMAELFLHLKAGQRRSILDNVRKATTEKNADHSASFLESIFDTINTLKESEVWNAFFEAFCQVYEKAPDKVRQITQTLYEKESWKTNELAAKFIGKMVGRFKVDEPMLQQALFNIASDDHFIRLMSTEILYEAGERFAIFILNSVITADQKKYNNDEKIRSLFRIISGVKSIAPEKVFQFLELWPWWLHGIGAAIRDIFTCLADSDATATKRWLISKLNTADIRFTERSFIVFNILAKENVEIFSADDLKVFYNTALGVSKKTKVAFAGVVGNVARVDQNLASEMLARIFHQEGKDCQTAAIASLQDIVESHPEFVLQQGAKIIKLAASTRHWGFLQYFLPILRAYPRQKVSDLLTFFDQILNPEYLQKISIEDVFTEFLTLLKIFANENPSWTLRIAERCPLLSKGVAGALAAFYENVAEHSDDPIVLLRVLDGFSKIVSHGPLRLGHALKRALPRLDRKLGGRKVVKMVFKTYKEIHDAPILQDLFRAALEMASFTEQDIKTLLQDNELPAAARSILVTKRKQK